MLSGTCKYCGCTDAQACVGGCQWVNDPMTICSACFGMATNEDVQEVALAELRQMGETKIDLRISGATLLAINITLQHAIKQQEGTPSETLDFVRAFVDSTGTITIAELRDMEDEPLFIQIKAVVLFVIICYLLLMQQTNPKSVAKRLRAFVEETRGWAFPLVPGIYESIGRGLACPDALFTSVPTVPAAHSQS